MRLTGHDAFAFIKISHIDSLTDSLTSLIGELVTELRLISQAAWRKNSGLSSVLKVVLDCLKLGIKLLRGLKNRLKKGLSTREKIKSLLNFKARFALSKLKRMSMQDGKEDSLNGTHNCIPFFNIESLSYETRDKTY